jgi:hypothetical protein
MGNKNPGKKIAFVLGLLILSGGAVFAEDADEDADVNTEISLPQNTITVDIGPTVSIITTAWVYNMFFFGFVSIDAFGIATQYERQIVRHASITGRFEYDRVHISTVGLKWTMSAIFAEIHGRYYPFKFGVFFLDGMVGYANVFMNISVADIKANPAAHYFKFGGKLGARIDFGKPGGFVFEPAWGYYGAVGRSIKLANYAERDKAAAWRSFDELSQYLFTSGLRLSLGFGWRL